MSPFAFYTVITAHNLLIFAPNCLWNTQNSHQARATRSLGKLLGWAQACLPNADHCSGLDDSHFDFSGKIVGKTTAPLVGTRWTVYLCRGIVEG